MGGNSILAELEENTQQKDVHSERRTESTAFRCVLEIEWQRPVSFAIAILFVLITLLVVKPKSVGYALAIAVLQFLSVLLPLACIWFGDELGEYIPSVTKPSPDRLVRVGGWFLLFMRLVIWWVVYR